MELPNTRATVFVADVNDEYVTIQFERARLLRPRVAGLKTAFHDMCDNAVGLIDAIGPKIGHKAVVGRTHLRIRSLIVIAGSKSWLNRHSHDLNTQMTGGVIDDVASWLLTEGIGHLPARIGVYEANDAPCANEFGGEPAGERTDEGAINIAAPVSTNREIATPRPQKTRCSMFLLLAIGFCSSAHHADANNKQTIKRARIQVDRT